MVSDCRFTVALTKRQIFSLTLLVITFVDIYEIVTENDEENNSKKYYAEIVKGKGQRRINKKYLIKRKEDEKGVTSTDKLQQKYKKNRK